MSQTHDYVEASAVLAGLEVFGPADDEFGQLLRVLAGVLGELEQQHKAAVGVLGWGVVMSMALGRSAIVEPARGPGYWDCWAKTVDAAGKVLDAAGGLDLDIVPLRPIVVAVIDMARGVVNREAELQRRKARQGVNGDADRIMVHSAVTSGVVGVAASVH